MRTKRCLHKQAEDADGKAEIKAGIEKPNERPDQFVVERGINKLTKAMSKEFGIGIHKRCERGAIDHVKVSRSSSVYRCWETK